MERGGGFLDAMSDFHLLVYLGTDEALNIGVRAMAYRPFPYLMPISLSDGHMIPRGS
jgi:hypothetical protein